MVLSVCIAYTFRHCFGEHFEFTIRATFLMIFFKCIKIYSVKGNYLSKFILHRETAFHVSLLLV